MATGSITKLVQTFGSYWGWIDADPDAHRIFFNTESLSDVTTFDRLVVGQAVTFEEKIDHVTGGHATHLAIASIQPPKRANIA